jgi:hypothetical protein
LSPESDHKSGHARGVRDCSAIGLYHVSFSGHFWGNSGHQAELAKMSKMTDTVDKVDLPIGVMSFGGF